MTGIQVAEHKSTASGALYAVFRHEWRQLIFSPLTYVFQAGFLIFLSACIFLIADFYASDEASIRSMLTFLPWVALILVPALAMRAWSDEPGDRGIELTLSLPVPLWSIVGGKFLAGAAVLLLVLVFTTPFLATVAYLGNPDPGVVFAGYLAAALLLLSFYAIALFAAAVMREPVGAFVLGVAFLFFFLLLGWDVFGRLLRDQIPATLYGAIAGFSPKFWLDRLASGYIELAGIFYFLAMPLLFLAATAMVIKARGKSQTIGVKAMRSMVAMLGFVAGFAVLLAVTREIPAGLDLTSEREFTLHQGTLDVVNKLPSGVEIDLYWSESEASVPAAIKSHARRIRDHLQTIASRSNGRVSINIHDPLPDSEGEEEALAAGLHKVPMSSGDSFFLGATLRHEKRAGAIPYFDIRRARLLDYDVALALNGLAKSQVAKVGILSSLLQSQNVSQIRPGLSFISQLKQAYDIAIIPHFTAELPDNLDVLLIIDATILQRGMLYQIDQFVMNGGSLIVMMDPRVRFNPASDAVTPQPSQEINDISDLLLKYGVRYQGEQVTGDLNLASFVADKQQRRLSYPYWMRIRQDGLADTHPVTANLNEVFFAEAGSLSIVAEDQAMPIVSTTEKSGGLGREAFISGKPEELAAKFQPDGKSRIIAATLRGPFKSAFGVNTASRPATADGKKHLDRSTGTPIIFAVADADWIFDPFSLQRVEMNGRVAIRPLNDNLTFLLNMIEYASGDPALIAIRSRGQLQRPFTRVAALFSQAQQRYREQEGELVRKISNVETEISKIPSAAGVERIDQLPKSIRLKIRELQRELLPVRKNLREIRLKIRNDVERLGRRLTLINLLTGPFLVLGFGALAVALRRRKQY